MTKHMLQISLTAMGFVVIPTVMSSYQNMIISRQLLVDIILIQNILIIHDPPSETVSFPKENIVCVNTLTYLWCKRKSNITQSPPQPDFHGKIWHFSMEIRNYVPMLTTFIDRMLELKIDKDSIGIACVG